MKMNQIIKLIGISISVLGALSVAIIGKFTILVFISLVITYAGCFTFVFEQAITNFIEKVISVFKK